MAANHAAILFFLARWCDYENGLNKDRPDPQLGQGDRHPHEPQALEADGQPGSGLGGDVPGASPALLQEGVSLAGHSTLDYRDINTTICLSAFLCYKKLSIKVKFYGKVVRMAKKCYLFLNVLFNPQILSHQKVKSVGESLQKSNAILWPKNGHKS